MKRILEATLAAALWSRTPSAAAQAGLSCGSYPHPEDALAAMSRYFTDDEQEGLRVAINVPKVDSQAVRSVVRDPHVCSRLWQAVTTRLRADPVPHPTRPSDYVYRMFRIGPYYAVLFTDNRPPTPGMVVLGYDSLLLVFRASDLAYVAAITT